MKNKCTHSVFIAVPLRYPDARILWKCHACSALKTDVQDERITELEAAKDICHGTTKDFLDGKQLPGDWSDGTDAACPGWWRGLDRGCEKMEEKLLKRTEEAEAKWDNLPIVIKGVSFNKLQELLMIKTERDRLREYTEHKQSCLVHTEKGDTELTEEEVCTCGLCATLRGKGD